MKKLEKLIPETKKVLRKLAALKMTADFTFVGGSALSVYLGHRSSEDIDLFTWKEKLDGFKIQKHMEKAGFSENKLINLSDTQADFTIDKVKVTFFANGWDQLKRRKQIEDNLYIANLETLAVMKVNTLFMRAKFRDYYDLYILNLHHFTLPELYTLTSAKMSNLSTTLFQRALVFTGDIEDENIDHLKPKYKVTLKQIENHFTEKIKAWNESLKP